MKMAQDEIYVDGFKDGFLYLLCTYSATTKEWPETFAWGLGRYEFESQWIMPSWAIGQFSGYARYREQDK